MLGFGCLHHRDDGPLQQFVSLLHHHHTTLMAKLQEVLDAQAATASALQALAARLPAPAATATDLDTVLANEAANKAAADAIDPTPIS